MVSVCPTFKSIETTDLSLYLSGLEGLVIFRISRLSQDVLNGLVLKRVSVFGLKRVKTFQEEKVEPLKENLRVSVPNPTS